MTFGLTEDQYRFVYTTVVAPLETMGAKVWCYGSRARGDGKKFSDLDLMVESGRDLSREISSMLETLQQSNFPFMVDLVQLADFAEAYKASYLTDRTPYGLPMASP